MGQQQFIFIFWRVISGGVAPTAGTGEVWAGSSTQWLGRPGVSQVQQHANRHALDGLNRLTVRLCCDLSLFSSDITEEDLEEAGVLDPTHKQILLESLKQQHEQQQKWLYFMTDPNGPLRCTHLQSAEWHIMPSRKTRKGVFFKCTGCILL